MLDMENILGMQLTNCLADFPSGSAVKTPPCQCWTLVGVLDSIPGLGRPHGGGNGNPLQYLSGKSQAQRSLTSYSPWGQKESDMTERLNCSAAVRHELGTFSFVNNDIRFQISL